MSRTDVHTPYWAKKLQWEWRGYFVESHEHTKHSCNFSPKNESSLDCYLEMRSKGRNIHCGCKLCTNQDGRRQAIRSDRYKAKRLLSAGRWDDDMASRRLRW